MPNVERPQDFELIELLIREAGSNVASTSTQQGTDFESFRARFQSYIDQIPSYLHSVGKEGFFPHFFLGSFSTLIDSKIATKLKIEKIYFRFDTPGTLKVAVISNDKIQSYEDVKKHVKLISISEHNSDDKNCKFTSGDLGEILQKCLTPHQGKTIQAEAQGIKDASKGPVDSVLEMDFRLIQISRNNINKEGINVEVIDTRVLNSAVSKSFHEVKRGLWSKPESDITELTNSEVKIVKEFTERVLDKVSKIHSGYEHSNVYANPALVYANQAREAAHHGFLAGALVNFRYRHNLRVYLEQFAGRGYADIVLVPRGKDRSLNSIPIVIELKAATKAELKEGKIGEKSGTTPAAALKQAEDYTKGFQPNVMRVLTTANDMLCVGVNLDHPSPISDIATKSRDQEITPLFNDILGSIDERNSGKIDEGELKKQIQNNIERVYHTFPGTGEKGDNHYFSRFLLGQSLLLNEVKDLKTSFEKHIFVYEENVPTEVRLESKGRGIPQRQAAKKADEKLAESSRLDESHAVVTMVFVPESDKKSAYVMNIVESDGKAEILKKGIPLNKLEQKIGNRKIVELNLNFNIKEQKSDFKKYFSVEVNEPISLGEYNGKKSDKFKGDFKNVPYPKDFKKTFDEVLVSQLASLQDQSSSIGKYKKLFGKVGEAILPFKGLIEKEAHTQAVLHGAFDHYSDIKLGEPQQEDRALILTEFQTGRGKRIDMLVHGVKFANQASSAKEYDPVGLEVKGPREGKTADALITEANDQITKEYTKGVTYKTLTDGNKVAFMGVVFDKGANSADSLILMSKDEFASVEVVHSSVFSIGQQQCSKGRRTRSIGISCIDSLDKEKITEEEKEQRIKELFSTDKVVEKVKNIEFYDQLFKVSQKISKGEIIDKNVEEAFVVKIKDIDLDSIDSEIRDIVKEMRENIENKEEVKNILRRSGVAEKIGKVAEGAGLAFTAFLVGKHIANGDIEGLGYDALNLWVMPKIGEKISGKMLELGTKLDSQMLKGFAPVMGRAIGNFAAFLGLAESIKARQSATDPVDIKIADLNIATNSIFIAADVPAVVTETMSVAGLEAGVVGEFAGPVGAAVSVAVIIISQFVEAELEVEKLGEHIKLTDQEKHDLYWDFFLGKKVPDYIGNDLQAEEIYKQYISKILNQFKSNYDTIAISLPSILVTKEEYATSKHFRDKRQGHMMPSDVGKGIVELLGGFKCSTQTRVISNRLGFDLGTNITHFLYADDMNYYSRIVPSTIENYSVTCGPRGDDITIHEKNREILYTLPSQASCGDSSPHRGRILNRVLEKWSLQEHSGDCYNAVIYRNKNSRGYGSIYYIPAQNANVNIVFQEKDILNGDRDRRDNIENRYYFEKSLDSCKVYSPGKNFFHIAGKFSCDLGADGQKNIVITQGNLTTDSINIHSIIGSNRTNYLEFFNVDYVDGKGGNDVITAKNFTTIKGYFGDSIHGEGLVLLPINFNDMDNITHVNNITTIYNKSGAFISVDKQTSVKTADGLFVTPTKIDDKTSIVTNLHVTKSLRGDIVLDDELDNLRKIENSNFNITKQLSSANYHSTIGSSSNHIFYPDKEHHNFYWEAPSNTSHLYLFDNRNANITIAQANGILDFSQLNSTLNDMPFIENDKGEIKINKNGLNVTLLPDYKDVTVTFDGEEYYKLQNGELERDYCSHSLRIDGRFSVNGTDLLNHHNCFTFDSDKVLFLKLNNDLLLLSDRGALSISDYYSSVHKNWDLSIELSDKIMEPEEFGERADEFSSFRYYQPDEQGLEIYHNQPINKNDIGLVDLKGKSILDFDMKVMNDTLLLSHKNNTLVKIENWNTYQPAREMMLAFNDAIVSNSKCIASICNSEDVIVEFNKEKAILSTEQLFDAVRRNNLSEVENLLSMGADVNIRDKRSWAPLHCAADNDNKLDISRAILNRNANIEARTNIGETPLHIANAYGQLKIIELLVDKGASLEAKTNDGLTPLHVAIQHNNTTPKIIEFLLNKGVNIEAKTKNDWTPLHHAIFKDRLDIVRVLSSRGANIEAKTSDGKTPLDLAIQGNYTDIVGFLKQTELDKKLLTATENGDLSEVKKFVGQGANVNAIDVGIFGRKPIHIAAEKNYKDIIEFLLGKGISVDDTSNYGWTPLHYTASKGCLEVAKFLIDKGASINAQNVYGREPIHIAAEHDNKNIIELLLNKGVSVNEVDKDGWMSLHWASWNGHLSIIEYLVGKGANVNAKDRNGKTPLDLARDKGYNNVVEYLQQTQLGLDRQLLTAVQGGNLNEVKDFVVRGASLDTQDSNNGWTPIIYAAQGSKWDVVKFLIAQGAKFNNEITYQGTPLHFAAQEGNSNMVQFLLDKGANIEAQDAYNRKPLHIAVDANRLNVVNLLLDRGANLKATDMYGKTSLDLAIQKGYEDIVEVLTQKQLNLDKELLISTEKGDLEKVRESIKRGANVNVQDRQGWTPLFLAIQKNNFNIVELLLDNSADIKVKDNEGWTPLHWAVQSGSLDVVERLVERVADVNALTADSRTPYDLAINQNDTEIKEYLRSKSAVSSLMSIPQVILVDDSVRQRKRRHHHGDHARHHMSRKPLAIDSSNQPEIVASSGTRQSSWINNCISWAKKLAASTFSIIPALPSQYDIADKNNVKSDNKNIPQSTSSVGWNKFLNNENIALASCVADALDNTPSRRYQGLMSKGVEVVPSRRVAVEFALENFNSFVEDKIRNLDSKEQARICVELKGAYPEITASLERGVEFSGNVGLDNVLEKCKKCFCTNVLPKDKVSTCLSEIGVTKLGGNLNR